MLLNLLFIMIHCNVRKYAYKEIGFTTLWLIQLKYMCKFIEYSTNKLNIEHTNHMKLLMFNYNY